MPSSMQNTSYLYRPVLRRAWETTKKFKNLWLFGLFAVLVSSGGEYEIIYGGFNNNSQSGFIWSFIDGFKNGWSEGLQLAGGNFWQNFWNLFTTSYGALTLGLFVTLFILFLAFLMIWLVISSQIALVKGSSLANKNKKMSLGEGFDFANRNFWPVLGVTVISKIVFWFLFGLLGLEAWLLSGGSWWEISLFALSFIIVAVLVLIAAFVFKYQIFYLLLKKQGFIPAFQKAWQLFLSNWLISLEMSLIMLGVYLSTTILWIFAILLLAGIPIVILPFYLSVLSLGIKVALTVIAAILSLLSVAVLVSSMTVFQWAGWVALFERLEGGEETSKLTRVAEQIRNVPALVLGSEEQL